MLSGSPRKTIREFVNRVVQVFGCDGGGVLLPPGRRDRALGAGEPAGFGPRTAGSGRSRRTCRSTPTAGVALAPVRLGGRPLGSMALVGPPPSDQMVRAIANLAAITIEKARALEDASHAEAARQSEVLKSALLDSLAHDIKTPLTSIKAAVTSLLEQASGGDRELLTIINEEADRLNRLAAEVIEMARIEAGKLHLEKRRWRCPKLIAAALADLSGAAQGPAAQRGRPARLPPADADPRICRAGGEAVGRERAQVFARGLADFGVGGTEGWEDRDRRRRPGSRHRRERAPADFRQVLSRPAAPLRDEGHRHGAGDRQRHRGSARRENLGGERARPGLGVLLLAAGSWRSAQ